MNISFNSVVSYIKKFLEGLNSPSKTILKVGLLVCSFLLILSLEIFAMYLVRENMYYLELSVSVANSGVRSLVEMILAAFIVDFIS